MRNAIAVLAAMVLAPCVRAQEVPTAEWKKALAAVPTAVWGNGPVRDQARSRLQPLLDRPLAKAQARGLLETLAKGNPFLEEDSVSGTLEIEIGEGGEKTKVWFQLPSKYRKAHAPVGMVFAMHGGPAGSLKEAFGIAPQEFSYFQSQAQQHHLLLLAPAWIGDPTKLVMETYRRACARWNIDRNRVWMVGHSAGGVASFMVAPPWADRFAGIGPFVCGMEHGRRLDNAWNLPVYHVIGLKDNAFFVATARKNNERLKEAGGPLQVVEKKGGHDVYPDECTSSLEWLVARPRRFWVKDVHWSGDDARTEGGFYWVETGDGGYVGAGRGSAFLWRVAIQEGNRIRVEGDDPGTLHLSDELLDLDRPVTVVREDEEIFSGPVTRTLRAALEWVERTGDFSAVPTARLKLPE